jgi:hypothetical protein
MATRFGAFAIALLLGLAACREEGPAEKAGRKVDEAIEDIRHGDEGVLERAGREVDEALDEVKATGEKWEEEAEERAKRRD